MMSAYDVISIIQKSDRRDQNKKLAKILSTHTYTHTNTHTHTHTNTNAHTRTHACAHAHTHTNSKPTQSRFIIDKGKDWRICLYLKKQ